MSRRKPWFEGETTIVIQGRRAEDIVWIVMGATFLALTIWVASDAVLGGASTDDGIAAVFVLASPFLVWAMAGPVSRVRDRQPFFQADAEGLRLHPGFWPRPLPWSDIRSLPIQTISRVRGQNSQIRVLLRDPERTSAYLFGVGEIRLPLRMLGLSHKGAADLLRQLRRLRSESAPPAGEGVDPDLVLNAI